MNDDSAETTNRSAWFSVIAAALLLTGLNVAKPVHIDESIFLIFAGEFAKHPSNPYDFEFMIPGEGTANYCLSPPVVPYWLALGTYVVGSEPTALRCWMFPIALLFAWSVDFLAARFTLSLRKQIFWLCVFSPSILPSFSFMLDIPMMALGFTALALTMRSIERNSWSLALLAGVVAGVCMQTKYNGAVACGAILVWSVLKRQTLRGLVVCACAAAMFVGWEYFIALRQGDSHFLLNMKIRQSSGMRRVGHLILPLITQVAGLAVAPSLLGLAALGKRTKTIVAVALIAALGIVVHYFISSESGFFPRANGRPSVTAPTIVYGLAAIPVWIALFSVNSRLVRHGAAASKDERLLDWFLPLWLVLEFAGCFALSPFPAARRVFGVILVFTFGAGRLAHYNRTSPRLAWSCSAFSAALALLYCYVNLLDARAGEHAAEQAIATVAELEKAGNGSPGGEPTRVFAHDRCGPTGITYYLHRAGWTLMAPKDHYTPRRGDLIAVSEPETNYRDGLHDYPNLKVERVAALAAGDDFPLRLALRYYAGGYPIEHQEGVRFRIQIFRVLGDDASKNAPPPVQADHHNEKNSGRSA